MALVLSNATGGGLYSATTSWAGGVLPVLGDSVDIVAGDTIEVDGTYGAGDDTATAFVINGILKASRTASSELSFRGEVTIGNTGELDYGKSADPIPVGIIAKLRLNDSATLLAGEWGLTCDQTGKYFVYGASKTTNTDLTTQLLAAGTTFTVTDATGWAVGDTVVIATTSAGNSGAETEEATISAITGNDITISAGVTNLHEIGARVGNFTKNVKIEAFNSTYVSYQNLKTNSSSLPDTREIQHVELRYMGDNSTSVKYGGFRFDAGTQAAAQYTSIGNITGYATDQYLLDFYNFYPNRVTVNDCAHYNSNGGASAFYTRQGSVVTFNNCVVYRSGTGLISSWSQGGVNVIVNDCWFVGCSTGFNNSSGQGFTFNNTTFASCNTGINFGWGAAPTFNNCNIGYSNGLYDGACLYGWSAQTNANIIPSFYDCNFNVTNEYSTLTIASGGFKLFVSNKNVDPSQQEIYTPYGIFYRDNVTFRSGVASIRCEPLNATNPASNEWQIFAPTGEPVVVSGYLRKDALYGATNLPKVTLSGLGITENTYTMADVNDTWVQFHVSATQTTGTDGILTLKVEFQGATGGKAWIDGIVAPPTKAVNSGNLGYWADGQPAKLIASNFTSPDDIWNKLTADITLTGSIGKQLKDNVDIKTSESGVTEI